MRWLAETMPDVACLQELKASDHKFPERKLREAGYGVVWHGQKGWNGVAILARDRMPWKRVAACRANRMTRTAAISRRRSTGY
jgi:exonuclease III